MTPNALAKCPCGEEVFPGETYCSELCKEIAVDARPTDPADRLVASLRDPGEPVLPTDSEERKGIPIFSGLLNYFPLACSAVARLSKAGNDKHNPGQPMHWARGKSNDHPDCIGRHLIDYETQNPETGQYDDAAALAWRALALLQELEEKRLGALPSRGSR